MPVWLSPAIASPPEDGHGDRQQQRQDDAERGEREERAITEDGGKERRTGTGSRTKIGNRQQEPRRASAAQPASPMISQVRGRQIILISSTTITLAPQPRERPAPGSGDRDRSRPRVRPHRPGRRSG